MTSHAQLTILMIFSRDRLSSADRGLVRRRPEGPPAGARPSVHRFRGHVELRGPAVSALGRQLLRQRDRAAVGALHQSRLAS